MKILVVQLTDAAHLLLATPLLRCLKKELQSTELHLLTRHNTADVLAPNRYIDKLHRLHFNTHTTVAELKSEAFDQVLPLSDDAETNLLIQELNAPLLPQQQKGFKTFWQRLFRPKKERHPAELYLQKVALLGVENDGAGLDYFIPRSAEVPYTDLPASHLAGFIALAVTPSAASPWPVQLLQQLVQSIDHPIILIGSEKDRSLVESIRAADELRVYNACGKFTLHETADLVRKAKLLVAYDAYFVQTAAAFGKEIVWLHDAANNQLSPYYSAAFLKGKKEPVYDKVNLPTVLLNKKSGNSFEGSAAKFANDVVVSINKRLKRKA